MRHTGMALAAFASHRSQVDCQVGSRLPTLLTLSSPLANDFAIISDHSPWSPGPTFISRVCPYPSSGLELNKRASLPGLGQTHSPTKTLNL
ncbi:hypothetical protein EJ04DRAFT_228669 [Polyplosphaeria fusca]|uniref:Uncharacterized protein n=1 Tax=Polyplosphaeria fusca TaxID=682080 RepID=A0A9P4QXW7_9PLEO|nr:hypothetical protein EJ04DRAFT_228669 [Polyplosphaeria fusca]